MTAPVIITLGLHPSEIARISEAVDLFFETHGLPDKERLQLTLALDELATNAISYGYPDGCSEPGAVRVRLSLDAGMVTAMLEDHGIPFNPLETPEPDTTLGIEERSIGGLGVHFVRALMDEVTYERDGTMNRLTLRKRVHPPG